MLRHGIDGPKGRRSIWFLSVIGPLAGLPRRLLSVPGYFMVESHRLSRQWFLESSL